MLQIVAHQQERRVDLAAQPSNQIQNLLGIARVQRTSVGSSASTSFGRLARARDTATRCCCPTDSFSGR